MANSSDSRFSGVFVPVTTPFDPVTGDAAPVSLRENLRRWLEAPLDGIVLFGSTGEGDLLAVEERVRLTELVSDMIPSDCVLAVGAAAESTRGTIRLIGQLADAGAETVLVHPPWYYGSTLNAAALRDHFKAVADASPIPVMLYHIPKYTHVTLDAGLIGELARHPNVPALKDSSGDLKRLGDYIDAAEGHCAVFIGNGALFYAGLEMGAAGGVMALGNLAPKGCTDILRFFRAGDPGRAGALQERLAPVHREIVGGLGIPGVKAALDRIGMTGGPPRPPLRPLAEKSLKQVARVLQRAELME